MKRIVHLRSTSGSGNVPDAEWRQWVQPVKLWIAVGVAALVIAGCSSDGNSAPDTSTTAVPTSGADATTSTTAPAPSSTSTTVASTTTLPATTTTIATEDLIKQAVQDYSDAYHACGAAPAACVPESFTAVQGRSRSTVEQFAQGLVDAGLYFSADRRGSYVVAESVVLKTAAEATAIFCVFDAGTVLGPIGPDGLATVVNDQVLSLRDEYQLFLEDGTWRVGEKREVERLGEGSLCPPAE